MEVEGDTSIRCYSELVSESVINSMIEREVQLTSHKAAKTIITFTINDNFRKLTSESRMVGTRIILVVLAVKVEKCVWMWGRDETRYV